MDQPGLGSKRMLCSFESRKSDAVEMDEMMAAMVLTSLSCSPVVQSPPGAEPIFSGEQAGLNWFLVWQRPTTDALSHWLLFASRVLQSLKFPHLSRNLVLCDSD